jgi:hypothetical protein
VAGGIVRVLVLEGLWMPDRDVRARRLPFSPDPEEGKIHRLRRLHRFKRLEAKPCTKAPHGKIGNQT